MTEGARTVSIEASRVLVTGANRGIGAAFVDAVLDRGAERVYAGARNLESLVGVRERYGEHLVPVQLDVTVPSQVDDAVNQCKDIDLLVCNAGQGLMCGVLDPPDESAFREVFETNFFGPLHLVRGCAPALRANSGAILFIQSTGAVALSRSSPVYSASKAASLMMALGLREQLKADGVGVTNVFPGFIATDMTAAMNTPKATPWQVAERSLDAVESGAPSVFPDRFSELVAEGVEGRSRELLDDPHAVMNAIVHAFHSDPLAGS
jgi:NAD(P)-dependent dehydrogenase (short-subunit alcohol dehydrogenase family)